jgi:hypothetical protein
MMRKLLMAVLAAACMGAGDLRARAQSPVADPLAQEIARWSQTVEQAPAAEELWKDVKSGAASALTTAREALDRGQRLVALERFAAARQNVAAAQYATSQPPAIRTALPGFEREWERIRGVLAPQLSSPPRAAVVETLRPAALRAMAEAALPQVKIYFDASLEYGRNTTPLFGLFYLGAAQAQRDFVTLARTLHSSTTSAAPAVRGLAPELDALEGELLAAYRPPLAIDRHPDFIAASAALKEARELDAAGLHYAALLKYLQSAQRVGVLRAGAIQDAAALRESLATFESRVAAAGVDHTIGRLFVERAQVAASSGKDAATVQAIVQDVLPRYFAALEPATSAAPKPAPRATVTLVRWPFT